MLLQTFVDEDAKETTTHSTQYLYFPRRVCHLFSSRLVWKGHRENPRPVAYVLGKGPSRIIVPPFARIEVSERDGNARSGRPGPRDGRDGNAVDFVDGILMLLFTSSSNSKAAETPTTTTLQTTTTTILSATFVEHHKNSFSMADFYGDHHLLRIKPTKECDEPLFFCRGKGDFDNIIIKTTTKETPKKALLCLSQKGKKIWL